MGLLGAVIGDGLLGLGAAALGKKRTTQPVFGASAEATAAERPETPVAPAPVETEAGASGTTANAQMEAERERELRAAELRKLQAPEVFTSGLGAAGTAATAKKSLLGG